MDESEAAATGRSSSSPGRSGPPSRRPTSPALVELQEDLTDALGARVKISMGPRKGNVRIDFGTVDDLERIVGVIARGLQTDLSLGD